MVVSLGGRECPDAGSELLAIVHSAARKRRREAHDDAFARVDEEVNVLVRVTEVWAASDLKWSARRPSTAPVQEDSARRQRRAEPCPVHRVEHDVLELVGFAGSTVTSLYPPHVT